MRVIFRMSAIVAALAIVAAGSLAGCGQRGPLYMPTVPPLPPKPKLQTEPQPGDVAPTPETASAASAPIGSVPDTSGTPLSLTPDDAMSPSSSATPQMRQMQQTSPAPASQPTE